MKAADVEHHEKTRADWILQHKASGFPMSDRRMSNQLRLKAARKERSKAGAAESALHEAQIKPFVSRWISGGEDQTDRGGRAFWATALVLPAGIAIGPMLAVSKGLYTVYSEWILRQVKKKDKTDEKEVGVQRIPKAVPWLIAALVVAVVAGVLTPLLPVRIIQPWPWQVSYEPANVLIIYALWQLAFGTLLTAWQVRRHGWPGITLKASPKTPNLPATRIPSPARVTESAVPVQQVSTDPEVSEPQAPQLPKAPAIPKAPQLPQPPPQPQASEAVQEEYPDDLDISDIQFDVGAWMTNEQGETKTNEGSKDNV